MICDIITVYVMSFMFRIHCSDLILWLYKTRGVVCFDYKYVL